jgi:hypothetical protein
MSKNVLQLTDVDESNEGRCRSHVTRANKTIGFIIVPNFFKVVYGLYIYNP